LSYETEIAWAAGFFDGEGTTAYQSTGTNNSGQPRRQLRLTVTQKDPRPLHRLCMALSAGKVYGPYESQNGMHMWTVQCARAEEVLEEMWPYLSEPKIEQATRALEAWRSRPNQRKSWAVSRRAA
jgi:hypothetical protein